MSIAVSLTIAQWQKQPECPPVDEWGNKMWTIFNTVEYYLTLKRKEILIRATSHTHLENIMLSEIS